MNLSTLTSRVGEILSTGLAGLLFESDSDSAADRRAYTRVRARFEGSVDLEGRRIPVRGTDLHRAGAGITADAPLPLGTLVFFYERTHGLMGWATVRWCSWQGGSKYHAGIEFRGPLMRAEAGNWQFSYVQSSSCPAGVPVSTN
jgi:hypothetical protein